MELMQAVELVVELIKCALWPIVVMILGWKYRDEFRRLLERLNVAKLPGAEFGFEKLPQPTGANEERAPGGVAFTPPADIAAVAGVAPAKDPRRWNYFWLGHDLMWTEDNIYRGAPKENIIHGLGTSISHLRRLGIADSSYEATLSALRDRVISMLEVDLTPENRRLIGLDIANLKVRLGAYVKGVNEQ